MRCIDRQLQDSLATVLRQYPAIDAAFLFGSRAEGKAGPASDFDIALVGVRAELQAKKLDILAELVAAGFERTDLVLLDGADPSMQFEAVRRNCLIFARPGFDRGLIIRAWYGCTSILNLTCASSAKP